MAGHGKELRGLDATARSSLAQGRFGRLFRSLAPARHSEDALHDLAETMIATETDDRPITQAEPDEENPTIPAGYTYLGQFIDHDITFDPVSVLQAVDDPDALVDYRTPRLDLDSLYGRGPADQPYLYEVDDPNRMLLGPNRHPPTMAAARPDLPRNSAGTALIGDPRNDENTIVSQLQSLFLRFHNAVVDRLDGIPDPATRLTEAQRLVRWHYQWIVLHDFLPRIAGMEVVRDILPKGATAPRLRCYEPRALPFMPVEFSVAAYRFGHSMVRPSYSLNTESLTGSDLTRQRIPIFSVNASVADDERSSLRGFRPLVKAWGIDWSFFFPGLPVPDAPPGGAPFLVPQPSYRIDTQLVDPLAHLPPPGVPRGPSGTPTTSLAERNLQRGRALGLPSGQAVAKHLGHKPLTDAELWSNDADPALEARRQQVVADRPEFAGSAPLWFYVLREAERTTRTGVADPTGRGGHHLGPVGARIVAEVLIGLVWYDHHSYLYQEPTWQPTKPYASRKGSFAMSDLVTFTDAS